jgi:hypothetical protein
MDAMVEVIWMGLTDKLDTIGPIRFVGAEWWKEAPRFVLLRYEQDGNGVPCGIRMDLDKRVLLDSVGDDRLDMLINSQREKIWFAIAGDPKNAIMRSIHSNSQISAFIGLP